MSLELIPCTSKLEWNRFADASPQGSVFCRTECLDALAVEYDLWQVVEEGAPQAGAVILRRENEPLCAPHAFTLYQGLVFAREGCALPPHRRANWVLRSTEALLAGLSERYDRLSFCLHHSVWDLRGL